MLPVLLAATPGPWVAYHNVVGHDPDPGWREYLVGDGDGVVSLASARLDDMRQLRSQVDCAGRSHQRASPSAKHSGSASRAVRAIGRARAFSSKLRRPVWPTARTAEQVAQLPDAVIERPIDFSMVAVERFSIRARNGALPLTKRGSNSGTVSRETRRWPTSAAGRTRDRRIALARTAAWWSMSAPRNFQIAAVSRHLLARLSRRQRSPRRLVRSSNFSSPRMTGTLAGASIPSRTALPFVRRTVMVMSLPIRIFS